MHQSPIWIGRKRGTGRAALIAAKAEWSRDYVYDAPTGGLVTKQTHNALVFERRRNYALHKARMEAK